MWTTPIAKLAAVTLFGLVFGMVLGFIAGQMPAEIIPIIGKGLGTFFGGLWILISIKIPPHLFTASATLVVAVIAWRALKQKQNADRKTEWWKRTQYALDQLTEKDNLQSNLLGAELVDFLSENHKAYPKLVDQADRKLFKDVVEKLSASVDRADRIKTSDEGGKQ